MRAARCASRSSNQRQQARSSLSGASAICSAHPMMLASGLFSSCATLDSACRATSFGVRHPAAAVHVDARRDWVRRDVADQRVDGHEPFVDRRDCRRDLHGQLGAGRRRRRAIPVSDQNDAQTVDETRALGRIDEARRRQRLDLGIGHAGGVAEQAPERSIDDDGRVGILLADRQQSDIDAFVNAVEQTREDSRTMIVRNRRARARQSRRL